MSDDGRDILWIGPGGADADITPERAGAKAAGLAQIARLGLRTPPAFVLPTSLCAEVNAHPSDATGLISSRLRQGVQRLEAASGRRLGDDRAPLLVSVRSGAAKSMPGMLATVLNVGLSASAAHGLIRSTGNPRFAWDSYCRFIESYAVVVGGAPADAFARCLDAMARAESAVDQSALDGEALERLAGQFDDIAMRQAQRRIPADPMDQLTEAALAVFRSWDGRKSREYRRLNNIEGLAGTAVTVQVMVFGNSGLNSGAGVAFTRNPATGEKGLYVDFLFDAQGEDVVSGRRTPTDAAMLAARLPNAFAELTRGAGLLERALGDVQDIEFTVEAGELYFMQTRAAKRSPQAALRSAIDLVHEGLIGPSEAVRRVDAVDLARASTTRFAEAIEAVARGMPAAPGVASGRVALDSNSAVRLAQAGEPVILVRRQPDTEDIDGFAAADGVLTALGGRTAHAAVVARQMAKVCVVGCEGLEIDQAAGAAQIAGRPLRRGDWLSLDGDTGEVTLGRRPIVTQAPTEELAEIARWRASCSALA